MKEKQDHGEMRRRPTIRILLNKWQRQKEMEQMCLLVFLASLHIKLSSLDDAKTMDKNYLHAITLNRIYPQAHR